MGFGDMQGRHVRPSTVKCVRDGGRPRPGRRAYSWRPSGTCGEWRWRRPCRNGGMDGRVVTGPWGPVTTRGAGAAALQWQRLGCPGARARPPRPDVSPPCTG
ncbi:hypothetical protein GCM10023334_104930 [Nonomuraea thailandensis]